MCPAVPTTTWRGAIMEAGRGCVLLADPFHLLHLLVVVLAEEEIPLGAAFRHVALVQGDLAPDGLLHLVFLHELRLEDLQDPLADGVRVEQELDALLVLEGVDEEVRQVHAALVAESHEITILRSRASFDFTLRNSSW